MSPSLIVDTNSGDPSTLGYYYVTDFTPTTYLHFINQVKRGGGLQFTDHTGSEVFVPHHAISAIVYRPGGES